MPNQTTKSILVTAKIDDVYNVWANFENFPRFMQNIESVTKTGENTSHWVMSGPLGFKVEWDAETTRMEKNTRIAWNSREGSTITTSGQVTFNELPQDKTEVTVTLQYDPPAGVLGEVAAKLLANPEGRLEEDLRNFKTYVEGKNERTA